MNYLLSRNIMNANNKKVISLIELYIQTRIEYHIALFSLQDLLNNQNYIIKDTKNIIYDELEKYLVKLIKQNSLILFLEQGNAIEDIAEQICFKLRPIIAEQLEQYINEIRLFIPQSRILKIAS